MSLANNHEKAEIEDITDENSTMKTSIGQLSMEIEYD